MGMAKTTLSDRAVIRLAGEGVRDFLQGLVTNDVAGDLPVWAGLLTPQGKALFDFIVWPDFENPGDNLLIDCEASQADALVRRLSIYRLRRAIRIERTDLAAHWSLDGENGTSDPRLSALGMRWIGPADEPADGWLAHRLSLGVTEGVTELGQDKTLWLECNAREFSGVSFTKGCYVGQENTARMHHRSKVNRHLAVIPASQDPGEAARIWYPELGLAVVHQKVT
jgi:tRNA-modifying protein YgfZ